MNLDQYTNRDFDEPKSFYLDGKSDLEYPSPAPNATRERPRAVEGRLYLSPDESYRVVCSGDEGVPLHPWGNESPAPVMTESGDWYAYDADSPSGYRVAWALWRRSSGPLVATLTRYLW
jgi:hypothetical protein